MTSRAKRRGPSLASVSAGHCSRNRCAKTAISSRRSSNRDFALDLVYACVQVALHPDNETARHWEVTIGADRTIFPAIERPQQQRLLPPRQEMEIVQ